MNFEDRMRQLASAILQYEVDDTGWVDWDGRSQLSTFNGPETMLLVADLIAAARDRVELDLEADSPCWSHLQGAIDALDAHHEKEKV